VALGLANQLLGAWARINNPNANDGMRYNRYGYSPYYYNPYGMSQNGIPLTRSAQVRNIADLVKLLKRLRALPALGAQSLDESAVVSAFTAAHSHAEGFRKEDVEAVFGPVDAIPSKTLTPILTTMRERLARDWRTPQVQTQAKTKRTDKELQAEVTRVHMPQHSDMQFPHARIRNANGDLVELGYGPRSCRPTEQSRANGMSWPQNSWTFRWQQMQKDAELEGVA